MAFNFGFKKKRDQRPMTISQEKRKADENRQRGEQIRASLEILDAKLIRKAAQNTEGGISGEKLEQYHKALQEMEKKLDEQKASVLDTVVIDSIIGEFIDQMADELVKDNKETADRLMAGLSYGISKGREEINMADPEATKKAMDARREILYRYQQIIRFSAHIDDLDRSIQRQKADIDQTVEAYKVRHEKLKEIRRKMPGLQENLDRLQAGQEVDGEVIDFNNMKRGVIDMHNHIQNLIKTKAANEKQRTAFEQAIRTQRLMLTQAENQLDQEAYEEMLKSQQSFQQFIYDQINQIEEMQKVNDQFTKILDAAFSSRKMIDMIIKTEEEYEQLRQKEMDKADADERGRQKILEEEQEYVNTHQSMQQEN